MFLTENIKSGHRTNSWSSQGKNVPNIVSIPNYDALIQVLLNIFVPSGKIYLSAMSSNQKVFKEPAAGVNEEKILPKNCQKLQIIVFVFF